MAEQSDPSSEHSSTLLFLQWASPKEEQSVRAPSLDRRPLTIVRSPSPASSAKSSWTPAVSSGRPSKIANERPTRGPRWQEQTPEYGVGGR